MTIILTSVPHVFLGRRSDTEQFRWMLVGLCCGQVTLSLRNPLWPRGRHYVIPHICCKYNLIDSPERRDWSGIHNTPRVCLQCRRPGFNPGLGRTLEKELATRSSILAWRMLQTEEPSGLQSMGSKRVGQDWANNTLSPEKTVLDFKPDEKKKKKNQRVNENKT